MSAAGSDSDAETVITEGMIEREKGSKEKGTLGKVSQMTDVRWAWVEDRLKYCRTVRYKLVVVHACLD